jgi:hypothetical protein
MNKKNKKSLSDIDPGFARGIKEKYGHVLERNDIPDEMKLSAKLITMVEPYDMDNKHILYDCAAIAWNECLAEDEKTDTNFSPSNALVNFEQHRALIDLLKQRKRQLFPTDRREIQKVTVIDKGNGDLNVNVASSINTNAMLTALKRMMETLE